MRRSVEKLEERGEVEGFEAGDARREAKDSYH
jgi:hypothetical protein